MKNHKPLTLSSYKSMWRHIERELPDRPISAHILRHTFITRMFEAGLDIKEIQYLAGHSTENLTLRIYTHYDQRSAEKKLPKKYVPPSNRAHDAKNPLNPLGHNGLRAQKNLQHFCNKRAEKCPKTA